MNFLDLRQYNGVLNVSHRLLDLVISNVECNVVRDKSPTVKEDDHHAALLIFPKLFYKAQPSFAKGSDSRCYNFRKANFLELYQAIYLTDWSYLSQFSSVDAAVEGFYHKLYEILDLYVPKSRVFKRQFPCWYTADIIKNIKLKERYFRRYKAYSNNADLDEYKRLRSVIKTQIKFAYGD
nr:unnamed protein product [Callosobruchus analis]